MSKTKNSQKSARNDAAKPRARDPETGHLLLRPGQPHIGSKLDYDLEKRVCECIAQGMSLIDSCGLKERGAAEPESRYAEFLQTCLKAELACKKVWTAKVAANDDWRALAFLLKAKWPKEFAEFVRQELSGVDGQPIELHQINPFNVQVIMEGPSDVQFRTIDHSQPHRESAQLPDPFAEPAPIDPPAIPNQAEQLAQSRRNQENARSRWTGSHPLERVGRVK